jgi:hypothetical protein
MLRTGPCFVPVTGIERWLSATSLIFGIIDFVTQAAQDLDRVDGHLRQQLVDEAGNE